MSESKTTAEPSDLDPDARTWLPEERAMVYSALDQIQINRRCECNQPPSFTDPCDCMHSAIMRVVADLEAQEDAERGRR